jgi:hypothetical protein
MTHTRTTPGRRPERAAERAEVSEDDEARGAEPITLGNWQHELPWTELASRELPELRQVGLIIKGKDRRGKLAIVLRVHSVKITVGHHLKGHFFGLWSNPVARGTGFLQFGLTICHF